MAQPSSTHSTYDHIGRREDLSDIIYDVSPVDTPYLTAIPKGKATSTKHEWLTRSLAAASGSNAVIEGDDATTDAANANVRLFNYTQISDKVARVSGTQEAVNNAGMPRTMAREMADKMKELKLDVETTLLQDVAYVAGTDTLARKMAGFSTYVKTNISKASNGTAATGDGSDAYTEGTARAFTEDLLEAALATGWSNGAKPTMAVCNAFQKRRFATFAGRSTPTSNGDSRKVTNNVEIYIDPLGTELRVVPCRQAPTDKVFAVDPEYLEFTTLRDFQTSELAKTGDSQQKQILVEYTQEVRNEKAHCMVADLTTS
ncbi:MAG TPA: DUF5309 domain-containing protein [Edaphobacter sp.]|nr:DUF5309 domain-containing protein [Edaphobacter sp.]